MLKVGMYVRCPVDVEAEVIEEARTFYLGQIVKVDEALDKVEVYFHDPLKMRSFFRTMPDKRTYQGKDVKRTIALENSIVIFKGRRVKLLCLSKERDKVNLYTYFVEYLKDKKAAVGEVSESQIQIPFTRANYNPINQLMRYELQNPRWYISRRIVSKSLNIIRNSPFGFKNLLGTRVHLFTHQVDTIVRALSENPCRLMLADEVGLGKTIEALAIIKGMTDKKPNLSSLIIVPDTLVYQWQIEISFKFWHEVPIWGVDNVKDSLMLLVKHSDMMEHFEKIHSIQQWDICIVDETHKLLNNPLLYKAVLQLCKETENVLLLSATPILRREEEYGKLLTLLNPQRFENMPSEQFNDLLGRQKSIQDLVFSLMRDLPDYINYTMCDDFIEGLGQINDAINDPKLVEIIDGIDDQSGDMGLSQVKLALYYIAEFYQIERGIIRHRRAEIATSDFKRKLVEISYEMAGSDVGFYEANCYNAVLDLADEISNSINGDLDLLKRLISGISSSPYALIEVLENNKAVLKEYQTEKVLLDVKKWEQAFDNEISRITEVSDDIENFHSKFARIVDYIDQEDVDSDKKFLIFTAFNATAKTLEECLKKYFGDKSTCSFHSGKTPEEMQEAATLFQNQKSYRFMICDESGGEGRNFQVADYIIHCDLPWSPATLEQRIGRLDRIGRMNGKDVVSVVVHSSDTLDDNLFDVFDKGLNIFNQSLCGMEIAFEEIHNIIETALKSDVKFGLAEIVPEISNFAEQMNEEIEKERYYDLARQLDMDLQEKLDKLIAHFTSKDGEELMNTMMAWPYMAGFRGIMCDDIYKDGSKVISIDTTKFNEASMRNALYFPPKMDDIIKRSKFKDDIRGTFSRSTAVKHENLTFFAPFNPLFDSITNNAEECYRGRSTALEYSGCHLQWIGLVETWNIRYNPLLIYQKGLSSELITLINQYLPNEQIVYTNGVNDNYSKIQTLDILDQINAFGLDKGTHLGKRDDGSIDRFQKLFPPKIWSCFVKESYEKGRQYAEEQTRIFSEVENARSELERILTANYAREIFYGYKDENMLLQNTDEIAALLYGLENPIIELDSIAFVILNK